MSRSFIAHAVRRIHAALVWSVLLPVAFYRRVLSPLKRNPTCRFVPTCSDYAMSAVRQRGLVIGVSLAVWRVLRCNPLFRGGYDPVPRCGCASASIEQELDAGSR